MIKDLEIILTEGESYTVEFKEVPDKTLAEEVCAFANASGGRVYIGISDKGEIKGTDTSNAARSKIQDTLNKIEPQLYFNIVVDTKTKIIIVDVPSGREKPYSCPRGFYVRFGPNSQKLDRNSIIEFLQAEGISRFDTIVNEKLSINDNFNQKAFEDYLKKANISNVLSKESLLINLGCAEKLKDGRIVFTNAGALFFRDNSKDIKYEHCIVTCALYKGITKMHILDVKDFNEGVVSNIDEAMLFLKKHLNVSYEIETTKRRDIWEIPEKALRESVVNSICHRDYFEIGSRVMIEIFDDRVEITNPGGVPKGITKENFGTVSITRNSVIASLLHRINYIEKMGTGINRIRESARESSTEFQFDMVGFFKVSFKRKKLVFGEAINLPNEGIKVQNEGINLPNEGINSQNEGINLPNEGINLPNEGINLPNEGINLPNEGINLPNEGINLPNEGINLTNEEIILKSIIENPQIRTIEIEELFNISDSTIYRILTKLKKEKRIERVGSKKDGFWKII
jgi:ATP-dependent DNA helicase RecG